MTALAPGTEPAPEPAPEPAAARPGIGRIVGASVAYVPAVIVAIAGWSHRWVNEDAFINLRIVDNVLGGHGPVFNPGERIEAATSPLWLWVLVVAKAGFGWVASAPWIALVASLVAAVAAFALGGYGTRLVHRDDIGVAVPVGLLCIAVLSPVWDFATSGLEMGLVWLWLAACWLALVTVTRTPETGGRVRIGWCVVIGLGPLVRPDLGLMMVCFMVAWFVLAHPRRIVPDLAAILALPFAYEIFRMGYFASVVPSTALAKDAGGLHLGQGWDYVVDLVAPYHLWIAGLVLVAVVGLRHVAQHGAFRVATAAMVAAGLVHAGYMIVIGGDYMHGRLLLPALFALALPASIALRRVRGIDLAGMAIVGVAACWAAFTLVALRPPAPPLGLAVQPIADWRQVAGGRIVPEDIQFGLNGLEAHAAYERGVRGFFGVTDKEPRPTDDPDAFVLTLGSIGLPAWHAGTDIWVIDIGGLAEPLAARTEPYPNRPAGHRKQIDPAWYEARFGVSTDDEKVQAARRALGCGDGKQLIDAVSAPMTPGRFLSNLWRSPGLTRMKIPDDPRVAEREWCGTG